MALTYSIGDVVVDATLPGKNGSQLADFSAGTEDPNPIHLDEEFAKSAGFKTVLQQGPMTTAHFSRLLAQEVGQDQLRWLDVTFTAPVFAGEELQIRAEVSEIDGALVVCKLSATKSDGTLTATADAAFEVAS